MSFKTFTTGLIGIVFGFFLAAILAYSYAPEMMIQEDVSQYNYQQTVDKLTLHAKEAGWKLPAVHDFQKTMQKHGYDVRPVSVFELCRVDYAAKILLDSSSRHVSSMMPCRIAVYENDQGQTVISRMNTGLVAKLFNDNIRTVMAQATAESDAIVNQLIQ